MSLPYRILSALAVVGLLWVAPSDAWLEEMPPVMNDVLLQRCSICHDLERVGMALSQGRSLAEIQEAMLARGAVLTEQDEQVLGTFWGQPSEAPPPRAAAQGPSVDAATYRQFQQVIETRCTLCHTRERVDAAIARQDSVEAIEAMMRQRGAVLTEEESSILKIFWDTPHR